MKKIYDKLLLLLAVLALLGGGAFYVLKSDAATDRESDFALEPAENPYEPVPVPNPESKDANWPEPEPQSSGPNWLYDVFTPPKIYLDAEGNFTAKPPKPVGLTEPFGIYLAEMARQPYRIQMQGFSGDREKPEEAVLFFYDEERDLRFFIREGQTNAEAGIEVLDFRIDRRIDAERGEAEVTAIATILDKRSGKEVQLNDESRLFESEVSVVFRSEQDPSVEVKLMVEPDDPVTSFGTPAGQYILKELSLEDRTVTVEKQASEDFEAKTRTLSPENFIEPEAPDSEPAATEAPSDENNFESFF